jgi:hypothetical protein
MKPNDKFIFGVIGIAVAFVAIWIPVLIWIASCIL